jgi:hypothetical protein
MSAAEMRAALGATRAELAVANEVLGFEPQKAEKPRAPRGRRPHVFVNVPFDRRYEPLFVALLVGIVGAGAHPRCVLEIPDDGRGRLKRLFDLIAECPISIHDLSRVTVSKGGGVPRFNMPFEAGLACGLALARGQHRYFVMEEAPFRMQRSLSDLNGIDPLLHGGTAQGMLREVTSCLAGSKPPPFSRVKRLHEHARTRVRQIQARYGVDGIFSRPAYTSAVAAIVGIAEHMGLVE